MLKDQDAVLSMKPPTGSPPQVTLHRVQCCRCSRRSCRTSSNFGVVKPERSAGTYFFDMRTLLAAKVALYLKESLGTRTSVLSKLMDAFTASQEELRTQNPNYVVFNCRLTADEEPIKLGVPCRALEAEVEKE